MAEKTSMGREPRLRVRDNPIALAQARRRTRPAHLPPVLGLTALACLSGLLFGLVARGQYPEVWSGVRLYLLALLAVPLYVRGSAQVRSVVSEDRENGLLDFHRATPTSTATDALGYILGCPTREYACAALVLPFLLLVTLLGGGGLLHGLVAVEVVVFSGWLYHTLGMVLGLTADRRRGRHASWVLVGALGVACLPRDTWGVPILAHLTPVPALASLGILGMDLAGKASRVDFFGLALPAVGFTLILQGSLIGFLFHAATRKLAHQDGRAFSRASATIFFASMSVIVLGGTSERIDSPEAAGAAGALYAFGALILACALAVHMVPTGPEFLRARRRALVRDRHPSWWQDGAAAWPLIPIFFLAFVLTMMLLAGTSSARTGVAIPEMIGPGTALTMISALAVLGLVVGVRETIGLRRTERARYSIAAVGFGLGLVPWIGSVAVEAVGLEGLSHYLAALSPIYAAGGSALLLGSDWGWASGVSEVQGALVVSLLLTVAYAVAAQVLAARERVAAWAGDPG